MASFGTTSWGLTPFGGATAEGETAAVEEDKKKPSSGLSTGSSVDTAEADIININEFEKSFFFGDPSTAISTAHVRAYIQTFAEPQQELSFGSPEAIDIVLKAKTWVRPPEPFSRDFISDVKDLAVIIRAAIREEKDLTASITPRGASVSDDEDLPAEIKGFFKKDLQGYIKAFTADEEDISGSIHGFVTRDLSASLTSFATKDLTGSLAATLPKDLTAAIESVPGKDLPASTTPVPGFDLPATGGAHPPEDLSALIDSIPPKDLPVFLRSALAGTKDLAAQLTPDGDFKDLSALLEAAQRETKDLVASLGVISQATKNLSASARPLHLQDLTASIITQRIRDARAIIAGYVREAEANLAAIVQRVDAGTKDLGVGPVKAVVSTHTSDKFPNLNKVSKRFFENRYAFGTREAGLLFLTIEPIFGFFPDLHAEITARDFFRRNLGAFLRIATFAQKDLGSEFVSVQSFVNSNKILLDLIPLLSLDAQLAQVGGFKGLRASTTPVHKSSTGTASDSGFIETASSYRLLLGTNKGLFIPPQLIPEIRISTFKNIHPRPDLHGTIEGWHETNLGASIQDYPFKALEASLNVLGLDHLSTLSAFIAAFRERDLSASLTASGDKSNFPGSLNVSGKIDDLGASLVPFVSPITFNVVTVSTVPFNDLGALINYGTLVRCSPVSQIKSLSAYVKPLVTGTEDTQVDLGGSLTVLRLTSGIGGDITGLKRTRIRLLDITFRSKTRETGFIRGSITPLVKSFAGLSAQIDGLLHEKDLPASLTPVRFGPHDVDFTAIEKVANFESGEIKDVLLSFRNQVQFYVYEEVSNAVYSTDRGTWAVDLRTIRQEDSFFDRSPLNREVVLDEFQEFYSLDEAIRSAIVLLCERRQANLSASLSPRGTINDLGVQVGIISGDRFSEMSASLVSVANSPDLAASINTGTFSSSFQSLTGTILPTYSETIQNLSSSVIGNIINDLGAGITAV